MNNVSYYGLQVADIYSGLECYDLVAAVGDTITIKG